MIAAGLIVVLTVAGAILAVAQQSIVRAIFGFALALIGVALAFFALAAPFVAAMQILIYIGGITIAMVFAVMLSSAGRLEGHKAGNWSVKRHVIAGLVALVFFVGIAAVITQADFGAASRPEVAPLESVQLWSVEALGHNLINRFNVAFELLSIVLLVAIIGAITIAAGHAEDTDPTPEKELGDA